MTTRVYITIDTECREERRVDGKLLPAAGYDLRIWGRFANQKRELGIRLLMDQLERHDLRATFYLDPFGSLYFGKEGLAEVVSELQGRGHDVQLHAHPIQREADWITRGIKAPSDHMADYSPEDQATLLAEGQKLLVAAGAHEDRLCSFRAGNFGADNNTWDAMGKVGLPISSNYNPCYADHGMRIRWAGNGTELFSAGEGMWELPITNMRQSDGSHRHLQITAISFFELRDALLQAHRLGFGEVTIVTHSFEFLHLDCADRKRGRLNKVNFLRLRALCAFLGRHGDKFKVETVGDLGERLRTGHPDPVGGGASSDRRNHAAQSRHGGESLRGRRLLRYGRLAEQALKRLDARLPF